MENNQKNKSKLNWNKSKKVEADQNEQILKMKFLKKKRKRKKKPYKNYLCRASTCLAEDDFFKSVNALGQLNGDPLG